MTKKGSGFSAQKFSTVHSSYLSVCRSSAVSSSSPTHRLTDWLNCMKASLSLSKRGYSTTTQPHTHPHHTPQAKSSSPSSPIRSHPSPSFPIHVVSSKQKKKTYVSDSEVPSESLVSSWSCVGLRDIFAVAAGACDQRRDIRDPQARGQSRAEQSLPLENRQSSALRHAKCKRRP